MSRFQEESILISGTCQLEGRLDRAEAEAGLVVTHPHPLYGGSMDNNVVAALIAAGAELGLTTLRFNFRGVGSSQGSHGDGLGEQEDLLAAIDHLLELGLKRILIGGYSFGTVVAARTVYGDRPVTAPLWVAPPVGMMPIDPEAVEPKPGLIIAGGNDIFCPEATLRELLTGLGPVDLKRLRPADHFFGGHERELTRLAVDFWAARLGR